VVPMMRSAATYAFVDKKDTSAGCFCAYPQKMGNMKKSANSFDSDKSYKRCTRHLGQTQTSRCVYASKPFAVAVRE